MSDDTVDALCYAINSKTGEKIGIVTGGIRPVIEKNKLAPGGMQCEKLFFEEFINPKEINIEIKPKTIKKKRFIKLLMSYGFRKNEADKLHTKYMKEFRTRSMLGLIFFIAIISEEGNLNGR